MNEKLRPDFGSGEDRNNRVLGSMTQGGAVAAPGLRLGRGSQPVGVAGNLAGHTGLRPDFGSGEDRNTS